VLARKFAVHSTTKSAKESCVNKKTLVRSALVVLAGVGLYKYVSSKRQKQPTEVWTAANMSDQSGKVIIVTGANSGIGFEAAKEFARKNAQVILACRDMDKAQTALDTITAEMPNAQATMMQLDLASQASVHQFAEDFLVHYDRLDVLVNNAGIMMVPYGTTEDGFERQLGTNHLGHFALTGLLIDRLLSTPGSRVVNVSSGAHRMGTMDFANLNYDGGSGYSPTGAYGRSKLANLLFTYELQRRYEAEGADAIAVAAHPGVSDTNLGNHLYDRWYFKLLEPFSDWFLQGADMGALPTLRAAVDPEVIGSDYYGPDGFMEQRGYPVKVPSSTASHNASDAAKLWQISEEMTGVRYLDRRAA
jgi:NAD(P)-dependent dehydrogenase (short-subunit alcohol dehydrogenase family)